MSEIELLMIFVGGLATVASLLEWRVRTMYSQIQDRILDKEKINQVVQDELRNDILRLEAKIDMLIRINLKDS